MTKAFYPCYMSLMLFQTFLQTNHSHSSSSALHGIKLLNIGPSDGFLSFFSCFPKLPVVISLLCDKQLVVKLALAQEDKLQIINKFSETVNMVSLIYWY